MPPRGRTDQHSTAGRAPSRVEITMTVTPGRSVAVRGYPAAGSPPSHRWRRSSRNGYLPGSYRCVELASVRLFEIRRDRQETARWISSDDSTADRCGAGRGAAFWLLYVLTE